MTGVANANSRSLTYIRICHSDFNSTFFFVVAQRQYSNSLTLACSSVDSNLSCCNQFFFTITKQPFFEPLLPLYKPRLICNLCTFIPYFCRSTSDLCYKAANMHVQMRVCTYLLVQFHFASFSRLLLNSK